MPSRGNRFRWRLGATTLCCGLILVAALHDAAEASAQAEGETRRITLPTQNDLAGLVDLCADQLSVPIEYDAKALKAQSITLRLDAPITKDELWSLVNQLLAGNGLTTVQNPGSNVLSVVPITQAVERARIEDDPSPIGDQAAGFQTVITRAKSRPVKEMVEALKLVMSKTGGNVAAIGDTGLLIISDLRPRVAQALSVLETIDLSQDQVTVESIPVQHSTGTTVAAVVTASVEAGNALRSQPLRGKLKPLPTDAGVVAIAPQDEMPIWRNLIAQFDASEPVETRSYTPRYFAIADVGRLIEQAARRAGPKGSGARWRLVTDDLTGTLIISATSAEHDLIDRLIDRLDSTPATGRQPIRTFQIRHRSVGEVLEVLNRLMQQGSLEGGELQGADLFSEIGASPTIAMQQSQREVLSSAGSLGQPTQPILPSSPRVEPSQSAEFPIQSPSRIPSTSQRSGRPATFGDHSVGVGTSRPLLSLTADEATNTLIAIGEPRLLGQLEGLLRVLDVRQPQVMLEAMVISLSDGDTLDLGVELQKIEISGSTIMSLSSIFGLGIPAATSAALPNPTGSGFTGLALNPGDFSVLIRALQTLNDGRSLSMPKVLVNNNQDATLDAVLQQPFTSTNASTTVATTSFGGTQDAGTTITVKPQIAAGDELVLTYSVALSSFVGESSDPNIPPPRQQNTVSSVVRIPDGYTVVVGGLELKTDSKAVSQIPLLGDVPILGELFKSRSNSDSTTRFYVFIRAAILRHEDFEDLKYLSDRDAKLADVDEGWPEVKPRVIR